MMSRTGVERRRRHYVDRRLQWWLIGLLLVIQMAVLGGGLVVIHHALAEAVEAQFYRAHPADVAMRELLLRELIDVVPALLMAELTALALLLWAWQRRVDGVITPLASILRGQRIPDAVVASHPLLREAALLTDRIRQEDAAVRSAVERAVSALGEGDARGACRRLLEVESHY